MEMYISVFHKKERKKIKKVSDTITKCKMYTKKLTRLKIQYKPFLFIVTTD